MKLSRSLSILFVSAVALVSTGCSCRTTVAGEGAGSNIPAPVADGPLKDINFAFDSYKLDTTAKSILNGNAEWLKANSGSKVQVEGHCDERGTNEYNMVLGANRARAAMDYLRGAGVEASRMSTVSYGEELPLDPAHNEAAWAKNRRDHFKVD
jgi:peptidoglycan-associated lipoprotein